MSTALQKLLLFPLCFPSYLFVLGFMIGGGILSIPTFAQKPVPGLPTVSTSQQSQAQAPTATDFLNQGLQYIRRNNSSLLCLHGFSLCAQVSFHTPKICRSGELAMINCPFVSQDI